MKWRELDSVPPLGPDEVHVWRVPLDAPPPESVTRRVLSPAERRRSDRLVTDAARRRFTGARIALRTLLGQYLSVPPEAVRIGTRASGKPFVMASPGAPILEFNLAHTSDVAIIAVARNLEVGVDVERFRRNVAFDRLVERFFADAEIATFRGLPEIERPSAFFRGWTRKEAYLKATDRGLGRSLPAALSRFSIEIEPGPSVVIEAPGRSRSPRRWSLVDFDAGPAYPAALVVQGTPRCEFCHWMAPWR